MKTSKEDVADEVQYHLRKLWKLQEPLWEQLWELSEAGDSSPTRTPWEKIWHSLWHLSEMLKVD